MKTKQLTPLILFMSFAGSLLVLSRLAGPVKRPVLAQGARIAVTGEKILVSLSNDTTTWADDTLYAINPTDGSGQTRVFDFHSHPKFTTGNIWGPRISPDGQHIYFHSEHAYIYTPARRNAFRVASDGSGLDQITPGEKSGVWGETGNSTVSGWVQQGDGTPWANAPVYLEGMDMVYSGADGSFSFSNVPPGVRWLVAYKPGDTPFDSTPVHVVSGVDNTGLVLVPASDYRMNFEYPVFYSNRVYYNFSGASIQWTDLNFSAQHTVYTPSTAGCVTTSQVKAFDVAPTSGRLVVFDYHGDGCTGNAGLYITDKDGGNKQVLLNMWNDSNWNEPLQAQIFWSPDESKVAFKGSYTSNYAWYDILVVVDATSGAILGYAFANTSSDVLTLHGWNPAGDWLLYSTESGNPAQKTLSKIKLNADGSFDFASDTVLLSNQPISGATWGNLVAPGGGASTATPTATATPTSTPTPTATATTSPGASASISLNYTSGQPGSSFVVSGQDFPTGSAAVYVNGTQVGTVTSGASFAFTLLTDAGAADGPYIVRVVNGTASASAVYTLDSGAPLRSDTSGSSLTVPAGVGPGYQLYLPLALK